MDEALCGCSKQLLDLQDASYVVNGVPFCRRSCFLTYVSNHERKTRARLDQVTREQATRIIARGDGTHVVIG